VLILIRGGEVYAPEPLGVTDVLVDMGSIIKVGPTDPKALEHLGVEHEVLDASGCVVVPGLIDPHQHLLGGSGEGGLALQTPMIFLSEIVAFGITTVVGVLGVDSTMKTMAGLLARVKGLREQGISTRMWTGGYNIPPTTVMSDVREEMLFIDEVVGAGEIAIADRRALQTWLPELAKVVLDTQVGGLLSGKAGVTHFHVGEEDERLERLRQLLDEFNIPAESLYPTHVTRSDELFDEALELVRRGATIDTDVAAGGMHRWARRWFESGAPSERFTFSSDAGSERPGKLFEEWRACIVRHGLPLERMLPLVTTNTARVLKLDKKGRLGAGCDADVVVLDADGLEIRDVFAMGRRMVRDGSLCVSERFLEESNRRIELYGRKEERERQEQEREGEREQARRPRGGPKPGTDARHRTRSRG
jgi:beta-aspartyl-dipeptidase (metallo-type)